MPFTVTTVSHKARDVSNRQGGDHDAETGIHGNAENQDHAEMRFGALNQSH